MCLRLLCLDAADTTGGEGKNGAASARAGVLLGALALATLLQLH